MSTPDDYEAMIQEAVRTADAIIEEARQTVTRMDAIDHEYGFANPTQSPLSVGLATVMSAMKAGLVTQDWANVGEAYVMLEQIQQQVRHAERVAAERTRRNDN